MALYQDGILISGANILPQMTLAEYNALPADQRPTYWERLDADYETTVLTGTLVTGSTTLTLSSSKITTDSMIDIYTNVYGLNPTDVVVTNGSITLTFEAQSNDVGVKVKVS